MRKIFLDFLTKKKDERRLSYEEMETATHMSKSKLQRIFTGQVDATVDDLEIIVEKGLRSSMAELYALIGEQEMKYSENLDYKGARALIEDFNEEKRQIRLEYQSRIDQLVADGDERQKAFTVALDQLGAQYRKNADFLTGIIKDNENYIRDLLVRTEQANGIAQAAQARAARAEKRIDNLDKRRHHVFWVMLSVVLILTGVIIASFGINIPAIGWGNL